MEIALKIDRKPKLHYKAPANDMTLRIHPPSIGLTRGSNATSARARTIVSIISHEAYVAVNASAQLEALMVLQRSCGEWLMPSSAASMRDNWSQEAGERA
jgi:hypothetical protein